MKVKSFIGGHRRYGFAQVVNKRGRPIEPKEELFFRLATGRVCRGMREGVVLCPPGRHEVIRYPRPGDVLVFQGRITKSPSQRFPEAKQWCRASEWRWMVTKIRERKLNPDNARHPNRRRPAPAYSRR